MATGLLAFLAVAVAALLPTTAGAALASERSADDCLLGKAPPLLPQMLALVAILGQTTGEPLECVRANPDNGDLLQQTSTGLLIYRTVTGAAVFTNGWTHWAVTPNGLVTWSGSGLDPPWVELAEVQASPPSGSARVVALTSPGASCSIDFITPSGNASRALGLEPRSADSTGQAHWSWRVGPSTRRGTAQVTVTCDGARASAPLAID